MMPQWIEEGAEALWTSIRPFVLPLGLGLLPFGLFVFIGSLTPIELFYPLYCLGLCLGGIVIGATHHHWPTSQDERGTIGIYLLLIAICTDMGHLVLTTQSWTAMGNMVFWFMLRNVLLGLGLAGTIYLGDRYANKIQNTILTWLEKR